MLTGKQRKNKGQDALEGSWVEYARSIARLIAHEWGHVTTDDLRRIVEVSPPHPNCWGVIFRGPEWYVVDRIPSGIPTNHAREIKVWGLA
jgi:hypothetical protein